MDTLMIVWVYMLSNFISFSIIILMLHVDDFMKFFILHCFYSYFLNEDFMVQVHNLSLILPSLDGLTYDLYDIFFAEFMNILRSPLRPPRTPKDPSVTPQGPPTAPPRTFQGHPQLIILWNSTYRSCRFSPDHIKRAFCLGSRAGIIHNFWFPGSTFV